MSRLVLWHDQFFEVLPRVGFKIQTAAELCGRSRYSVYKAMRNDEFRARLLALYAAAVAARVIRHERLEVLRKSA